MTTLAEDDVAIAVDAAQGAAAIGRVIDAGERAAALAGRTVLVGPLDPCGECDVCRRGGAAVCPRVRRRDPEAPLDAPWIAAARWVVALGDGLELPVPGGAAVAGDVALAYTLYARTGLAPREPAVVIGATPVARFLVEILRAKGMTPTVVADPAHEAWCDWLTGRGAAVARIAPSCDAADARAIVTATVTALGTGSRPWRVLAAAADVAATARAAELAGPRATLTLLAGTRTLPGDLVDREVTVVGVAGAHPDLVVEAAAMCVKREVDLEDGTALAPNDRMRAIVRVR